jgi:DNA-binding NarL/FixJ family response regulator
MYTQAGSKLTSREESIVALVAQSKSNKVIAFELCLTTGTIKEYLFTIFRKLNLPNRTAVAVWFINRHPDPVVPL